MEYLYSKTRKLASNSDIENQDKLWFRIGDLYCPIIIDSSNYDAVDEIKAKIVELIEKEKLHG